VLDTLEGRQGGDGGGEAEEVGGLLSHLTPVRRERPYPLTELVSRDSRLRRPYPACSGARVTDSQTEVNEGQGPSSLLPSGCVPGVREAEVKSAMLLRRTPPRALESEGGTFLSLVKKKEREPLPWHPQNVTVYHIRYLPDRIGPNGSLRRTGVAFTTLAF